MADSSPKTHKKPLGGAYLVASGILMSRIAGLVRLRVLAHFLGDSDAGDAFYAALKIPNFPQNLFGEGVLSASFIPVYANLVARGDEEQAGRVAGIVFSVLSAIVSVLVLIGIIATPFMIDIVAPGFTGEKRALTIHLVQLIFPGTGLLVLSAWCLGILNSHHKFFLSYAAPVLWNGAIIATLLVFGRGHSQSALATYAALGLLAGSVLQFGVQLPTALKLIPRLRLGFDFRFAPVREIIRNFVPVVIGRGVVQVSAYIDNILASYLPSGAVSALGYAQSVYMLPISLFGMSVSAAELPAMSGAFGTEDMAAVLKKRINSALRQIAFFVIPSVVGFLALGDAIVGLLYQTGQFNAQTSSYVWAVLAGSAVGLLATTLGRVYSSAFYSLRDTKTPLRFSLVRVFLTTALGYLMGLRLPVWLHISPTWGTAGLTASAGIAGWFEFLLLRKFLNNRIGQTGLELRFTARLWIAALVCGAVGYAIKIQLPVQHPMVRGLVVLAAFGALYFPLTAGLGIEESRRWTGRISSKFGRKS